VRRSGPSPAPREPRCRGRLPVGCGLLALAWLLLGCTPDGASGARRAVLVSIDTLRADHVGCYGADFARTPTLDALAARGTRFDVAISPAPLTLPSHATLLTGLDPPRHGARMNGHFELAPEVVTLAERAREAGLATAAFVAAFVLDSRFGLDQGFEVYDDALEAGRYSASGLFRVPERRGDAVVDAAIAWLEEAPDRFLLFVHLYDPHAAYDPPVGFAAALPGRPYDAEIAFADAQVGRLLEAVDRRFGDGRTAVVVTSDHGESLGEHGERTHAYFVYDATQRVPLLAAGPGWPAGAVVSDPVRLADVAPTLARSLGLASLPDPDGASLLPLAPAGGRSWRPPGGPRTAWVETLAPQIDFGWSPLLGLRTSEEKYIRAPTPELYDLRSDPGELHNLAPLRPERVAELDARLTARLAGRQAPLRPHGLDAAGRARLRALGYLAGPAPTRRPLGEVGGIDGKEHVEAIERFFEASRIVRTEPARALELARDMPQGAMTSQLRATAWLALGQPERAEAEARRALELGATPAARATLALALEARGRLSEAERLYREVLAESPREAGVLEGLGRVALARGDAGRAADLLHRALELDPEPAVRWSRYAAALEGLGRLEEALAAREAALARAPGDVALRNDVAWTLARLGRDLDRALQLAAAAADEPGAPAEVFDTLAEVHLARAEPAEALRAADRAAAAGARPPRVAGLRARALAALGRLPEARRALRRALSGGLDGPAGREELLRLAEALGVDPGGGGGR